VLEDVGKLVLRLTLGGLILLHGLHKIAYGVGGIENMLLAVGLPWWFAYGALVGEVVAPPLAILGYFARVGAGLIVIQMLFALCLAHRDQLLTLNAEGGATIKLQLLYLFAAVALALTGPGRFVVNRRRAARTARPSVRGRAARARTPASGCTASSG